MLRGFLRCNRTVDHVSLVDAESRAESLLSSSSEIPPTPDEPKWMTSRYSFNDYRGGRRLLVVSKKVRRGQPSESAAHRLRGRDQGASPSRFQTPVAAVSRAKSAKSRGGRPSARCTPSVRYELRPSSTSAISSEMGTASFSGSP